MIAESEISLRNLPDGVRVFIRDGSRKRIFDKAVSKAGGLNKLCRLGISTAGFTDWRNAKQSKYTKRFVPLSKLRAILKLIELDEESVQKDVVALKSVGSKKFISNVSLPIKVDERLVRILGHLLGDGFAPLNDQGEFKNTEDTLLDRFEKDLSVFGNVPVKRRRFGVRFPAIVTSILTVFKTDFGTFTGRVPKLIWSLDKRLAKEFIKALFDDEATVGDSRIDIRMANLILLKQLRELLFRVFEGEGLTSEDISEIKPVPRAFNFRVQGRAFGLFHKEIGFDHPQKMADLEFNIKRVMRPWKKKRNGETKAFIIKTLEKPHTIKELSRMLNVKFDTVFEHLVELEKLNIVCRPSKTREGKESAFLWQTSSQSQNEKIKT
ncbi:MAG: hypothetical protein HYW24_03285 [Candidatus Aenigmarchaeota archaeon]|nr:hypothetical protein [Candidatus Aenigmarchaeota archaeon]